MEVPEGWYPDPSVRLTKRYWTGEQWTSRVVEGDVGVGGATEKDVPTHYGLGDPEWVPSSSVDPAQDLAVHSWRHILILFVCFVIFFLAVFPNVEHGDGVWDTSLFGGGHGGPWLTAYWLGQSSALLGSFIYLYNFRKRKYKLWIYVTVAILVDSATIFFYWMNRAR